MTFILKHKSFIIRAYPILYSYQISNSEENFKGKENATLHIKKNLQQNENVCKRYEDRGKHVQD